MSNDLTKRDEDQQAMLESLIGGANLSQRPDFIPMGDKTGTEDIEREDIKIPRIAIAQGLSPEVLPGPERIPSLEVPQMFNDFTKKNYGTGPVYFIPIRRDRRCIEFKPREQGGGVVDMNVPWNDKRATEWGPKNAEGKSTPPVATRFNEWIVLILLNPQGDTESAIVSIKMRNKFNREASKNLNGFIKMYASQGTKSVPIYGVIYKMTSRAVPNTSGAGGMYGVPAFEPQGFVPQTEIGRLLFDRAQSYALDLQDKVVEAPRQPGEEEFVDAESVDGKPPF